ncbi:MAG: alpha/beta hydrolase [Pseudomonadota bacterium]
MQRLFSITALLCAVMSISGCSVFLTSDIPRQDLEAKYLERLEDVRDVAGTKMHVRVSGPSGAKTVILIHGVGSHLQTWDHWISALELEYRTVRFDLPGSGLSPPDRTGEYTDDRAIVLINSLMDDLGVEDAALIGNSLGGRIAWSFAASQPERVSKLILISPDGFASAGFEYGRAPDVPLAGSIVRYALPEWAVKRGLNSAFANPEKLAPETLQRYYDLLHGEGTRSALLRRMKQTILEAPEQRLGSILVPVLLIWGEEDRIIPLENASKFLAAVRDITLVTLPNVGHLPQEEAPEAAIDQILDFLASP